MMCDTIASARTLWCFVIGNSVNASTAPVCAPRCVRPWLGQFPHTTTCVAITILIRVPFFLGVVMAGVQFQNWSANTLGRSFRIGPTARMDTGVGAGPQDSFRGEWGAVSSLPFDSCVHPSVSPNKFLIVMARLTQQPPKGQLVATTSDVTAARTALRAWRGKAAGH